MKSRFTEKLEEGGQEESENRGIRWDLIGDVV